MADVKTGVGWLARQPLRLSLRAYGSEDLEASTGNLPAQPREALGKEIIKATVQYGALGTCRSATLEVVGAPAAWKGLYSRMVILDLESEHGVQPIFSGLLRIVKRVGRLATCEIVGLHVLLEEAVGGVQYSLNSPMTPLRYDIVVPAHAEFGLNFDYVLPDNTPLTRGERISQKLEPYPNADWGVNALRVGVAGLPKAATPISLNSLLEAQWGALSETGFTEPPYITDVVTTWPEGFGATVDTKGLYQMPSQGMYGIGTIFTPRRKGEGRADPQTVLETVTLNMQSGNVPFASMFLNGEDTPFSQAGSLNQKTIYLPERTAKRRPKTVRLSIPITVVSADADASMTFALGVGVDPSELRAGRVDMLTVSSANKGIVINRLYEFDRDLLERMTDLTVTVQRAASTGQGIVRVGPISAVADVEVINETALEYPEGWYMPYETGPAFERTLNGCWLIPPGWDEEAQQYVVGVEVIWEQKEATSHYLTGALPYRGQKRTG